jgi:AraC-like DNA-binding protein
MLERRRLGSDLEKGLSAVEGSVRLLDGPRPVQLDGYFDIASLNGASPAHLDLMLCGETYIGELLAPSHSFSRDYAMVAGRQTDDILVLAIHSGSFQGLSSNGPLTAGANEIVMIDLGEILMVETRDLVATVWVLPRPVAYSEQLGGTWWHGYVLPSTHKVTHLVVTMMHEATKLYRGIPDPTDCSLIDPVVVMLSSVLRSEQASVPGYPAAAASNTLLAVKRYIAEHVGDPDLGVDGLARQFGMSRASLYREFASVGGIAEYIRHQRLHRAQRELRAQGKQPLRLDALARKLGFKSAASFSRAFAAAFGVSPRGFKDREGGAGHRRPARAVKAE